MNEPLYATFGLDEECWAEARGLFKKEIRIDGHCPECGRDATFDSIEGPAWKAAMQFEAIPDGFSLVAIQCARNDRQQISFLLRKLGNTIQKVGQWPSLADIALDELKEYKSVLERQDAREFHKAVGLAAHGVGVGSFVYLRRIFENLIAKAYNENKAAQQWVDEDFYKQRMPERIAQLKAFLPEFVVKNRSVYGILSKGLHELSEEECLAYFEPLKMAILRILEQDRERQRKAQLDADLEKALAKISDLTGSGQQPAPQRQEIEISERPAAPADETDTSVSRAPPPIRPIR